MNTEILDKYADATVNFALGRGAGIKPGDTVYIRCAQIAEPLFRALNKAVVKAGGNVIPGYVPNGFDFDWANRDLFLNGSTEQISYFPKNFYKGIFSECQHLINVHTPQLLFSDISPDKKVGFARKIGAFNNKRTKLESQGKFSYTVIVYPTQYMADNGGLTLEECWQQIIKGCYLNEANPVEIWRGLQKKIHGVRDTFNNLNIKKIRIVGPNVNLEMELGKHRQFLGLSGRNFPSFELFTSPDWRTVNGWVQFDIPLIRGGKKITKIFLRFVNGIVIESRAEENYDLLQKILSTKNATKLGEIAFTDKNDSNITNGMGHTLFTENLGGTFHFALGKYYPQAYSGTEALTSKVARELGLNDCKTHDDIVFGGEFTVFAEIGEGREIELMSEGVFKVR